MKQQVVVIGLGRFGAAVAITMTELGHEVLGIDSDLENVQRLASKLSHVVQADATEQETLERLGLKDFDTAVVAIGENLEASILATLNLRLLGMRHIISKARTQPHGEILRRVGAHRVVFPEWDTGKSLAQAGLIDSITDSFEVTDSFLVVRVVAPQRFDGQRLGECGLGQADPLSVLVRWRSEVLEVTPEDDVTLSAGDVLVVAGRREQILKAFS
jgi:trk system potassium uptake protein TrkA